MRNLLKKKDDELEQYEQLLSRQPQQEPRVQRVVEELVQSPKEVTQADL